MGYEKLLNVDILKSTTLIMKAKLHTKIIVSVSMMLYSNCSVEQKEHTGRPGWETPILCWEWGGAGVTHER